MVEDVSRQRPSSQQRRLSDVPSFGIGSNAIFGRRLQLAIKRGIDAGFALLALFALWMPLLALCVIFRHSLVPIPTKARNGKMFKRLGFVFPPGRFARFMQESGLYRLPELFNLLKGDVSLVGPDPDAAAGGAKLTMRPGLIASSDPDYARKFSLLGDLGIILSVFSQRAR